jgi:hypothetical protein
MRGANKIIVVACTAKEKKGGSTQEGVNSVIFDQFG